MEYFLNVRLHHVMLCPIGIWMLTCQKYVDCSIGVVSVCVGYIHSSRIHPKPTKEHLGFRPLFDRLVQRSCVAHMYVKC